MAESQKVIEFISVTGESEERARFYLQSANWELHTALETFYDNDIADVSDVNEVSSLGSRPELSSNDPGYGASSSSNAMSSDTSVDTSVTGQSKGRKSKFATLGQYNSKDDSSDEEGQAFYAGGSERSGQQIIGPDKKKNPTQSLFDAAKQHGAEVVSQEGSQSRKPNSSFLFQGAGFKLGSDVQPSQQVGQSMQGQNRPSESRNIKIKFWKNGFSVDNGPLREFHGAANKEFLDSIAKGEVPAELRAMSESGEVHVDMEDHREEEYVKPKENLQAFSGAGHKLGSPTPEVIQQQSIPTAAASAVPKQPTFKVDETKPVTTIQIRLSDGTRLVSKFNHDNTIGDIRSLVRSSRPGNTNFNLMTTFPNKVLTDDSATIADSKLLNAVIVQRLI